MTSKTAATLLSVTAFLTGLTLAADYHVRFYDAAGAPILNRAAAVFDSEGHVLMKLAPEPEGVYLVVADPGRKLRFEVDEPALGLRNKTEARMPLEPTGPIAVHFAPAVPAQGAPANDECQAAVFVGPLPALVSGTTLGATIEPPDVPDCPTPGGTITAPGVWYRVNGTGNTITASTCELNSPGSADYDTKITVYCGFCDPMICVNSNDDTTDGGFCGFTFHSTVSWASASFSQYSILVHGFEASTGNFNLSLTDDGIPAIPTVDCHFEPNAACCLEDCGDPAFGHCEDLSVLQDCDGVSLGAGTTCAVPTGASSQYGSAPAAPIPSEPSGVEDTIVIGSSFLVADVTVDVIINHTWIGDLAIDLASPAGTTINLFDQRCGNRDNMDFNFSDTGTDNTSCAALTTGTGSGAPAIWGLGNMLGEFAGELVTGPWTIHVADNWAPSDSGTLLFWQLNFEEGRPACEFCGDGVLGANEPCDDGNRVDGDGCSATCQIEPPPEDDEGADGRGFVENEAVGGTRVGRRLPRR